MEDFKASTNSEEECELKWKRWKGYLHGIIFYLKRGKHLDELNELEKKVVEEWADSFYIDAGILKQRSRTSGKEIIPITSYLECFKRISECHISPDSSGRVVHLEFEETLTSALAGCIWPTAEDEVREYLKLCFQCNSTKSDHLLINDLTASYKDDLPLCFNSSNKASLLFSTTSDEMSSMNDMGVDDTMSNPPSQKSKSSTKRTVKNKSEAAKKTLAKAKRTLIKVNVEQRGRKRKSEMDSSSKTDEKDESNICTEDYTTATTTSEKKIKLTNGDKKSTPKSNKRTLRNYFKEETDSSKRLSLSPHATSKEISHDEEMNGRMEEKKAEQETNQDPKAASPISCMGCGLQVTCKSRLYDHWKLGSSSKKKFKCCLCPFVDASFSKFASHMELDHKLPKPTREYRKSILNPVVPEQLKSKVDQETTHPDSNLASSVCDQNVATSLESKDSPVKTADVGEVLSGHSKTSDPAEITDEGTETILEMAQTKTKSFSQIYNHICEICCTPLSSGTSLEYHLSFLHKISFSKFPFKVLSRSDPSHDSPKPFFPCGECEDRFWSAEGLNLHEIDVHSNPIEDNIKPIICPICKNDKIQDAMIHMSKHHITICDMYLSKFCAICSKHMSCPRSFEKHMLTVHKDHFKDRPSLYSAIFSQISGNDIPIDLGPLIEALKSHTPSATFVSHFHRSNMELDNPTQLAVSKHTCPDGLDEEEFKCPQCGCEFPDGESFEVHYNQYHHTKCPACEKDFQSKSALKRHIQFFHHDIDHQSLHPSTFPEVNFHHDGVEGDLLVVPSDWKPSLARPAGKIPRYVNTSLGDWIPEQNDVRVNC